MKNKLPKSVEKRLDDEFYGWFNGDPEAMGVYGQYKEIKKFLAQELARQKEEIWKEIYDEYEREQTENEK